MYPFPLRTHDQCRVCLVHLACEMNGFAKTAYYIHQVQWIKDRPLVRIAPHWNWSGREGQEVRVMVMSNAERVALS